MSLIQYVIKVDKSTGREEIVKKGLGPACAGYKAGMTFRGDPHLHYYVISKRDYRAKQEASQHNAATCPNCGTLLPTEPRTNQEDNAA